jgi:hypothetical protein
MSNTALPVEWTAGAELIQHPLRRTITDRALPKNASSQNVAVSPLLFNGLLDFLLRVAAVGALPVPSREFAVLREMG